MNLNKVFLIGNLTRDPEKRTTPQGQSVASFGLATNRIWTDAQGQKQQKAEFHNIVAWRKLADFVGNYLTKGKMIFVEGRIETRTWEDKEGIKRYKTEIIAENIQLGPRTASQIATPSEEKPEETSQEESPASEDEIQVKEIPF